VETRTTRAAVAISFTSAPSIASDGKTLDFGEFTARVTSPITRPNSRGGPRNKDAVIVADLNLDMIRKCAMYGSLSRPRPETYKDMSELLP